MIKDLLSSFARGVACTAVVFTLAAGSAWAGNVRLIWDPPFGAPYPSLGFAGDAALHYPDACLAFTGVVDTATDPCNAGPDFIAFTSVFLDLFDLTSDPTMSGAPAEHIDFLGSASGTIQNIIVGQNPSTSQNEVVGLNTSIFGPETSGAVNGFPGGDVWLQFLTPFSFLPACEFNCLVVGTPQAFMFVRTPAGFEGDTELCPDGDGNASCIRSAPATVTIITAIPEPASLALLMAAVGAAFLGRRRRHA
jgi:hypothetical protein